MDITEPSANIVKYEDMSCPMKSPSIPSEIGAPGKQPEGDITKYQAAAVVNYRRYVSEACRSSLDKFRFRSRIINAMPKPKQDYMVGVEDGGRHTVYPLDKAKIEAGPNVQAEFRTAEPVGGENLHNIPEEGKNLAIEGDPESSEYGPESGLYEILPILDAEYDLYQNMGIPGLYNPVIDEKACPNEGFFIGKNSGQAEDDDFGSIDDDILAAVTRLEAYDIPKEDTRTPVGWNMASNSADELSFMENAERCYSSERKQVFDTYLPLATPYKSLTRERFTVVKPVKTFQQSLLSTSNTTTHVPGIYHLPEILMDPRLGGGLQTVEEQFSPPSSVEVALNDYSQEQEVFDCNLQGSPSQDDTEARKCPIPNKIDLVGAHEVRKELGMVGVSKNTDEWLPAPKKFPYILSGALWNEEGGEEEEVNREAEEKEEEETEEVVAEGEEGEEEEYIAAEQIKNTPKAKRKKRVARVKWDKRSPKKRKIRTCNPSQLKLSNYAGFSHGTPKYSSAVPCNEKYDKDGKMNPFVRPQFLSVVPRGPSIVGLSAKLSVKTCFRVGEALRVGRMHASGHFVGDVLVELYGKNNPVVYINIGRPTRGH